MIIFPLRLELAELFSSYIQKICKLKMSPKLWGNKVLGILIGETDIAIMLDHEMMHDSTFKPDIEPP